MIQPRRIGRFLTVDKFGCIQPDIAVDLVGDAWKPLVEFVAHSLMRRCGALSVYVRGSIPRGLAIENVSDADFIYFSESDFDEADFDLENAAKEAFPIVNGVQIFRLDRERFDKIRYPRPRPYFHMLLKTQSLFLAGDDIVKDLEPFKIGPDLASHVFSLASEFSKLPSGLEEDRKRGVEQGVRHRWFSKRIVRSGLEITMTRSDRFTRDLYLCYEDFAEFYPERSGQMYRVLINCLNGEESPVQYRELVTFLAKEGLRILAS
jgi:uncharacterized protein